MLERNEQVAGLARTLVFADYRFNLGDHRLYSPWPNVTDWIVDVMDSDMLEVVHCCRIFLKRRYLDYPVQFPNAFTALSAAKPGQVLASYLKVSLGRGGYCFYRGLTSAIGIARYLCPRWNHSSWVSQKPLLQTKKEVGNIADESSYSHYRGWPGWFDRRL